MFRSPVIEIVPDNVFCVKLFKDDAKEIVYKHLLNGIILERFLYENPKTNERIQKKNEILFYKKQVKIALKNCGIIDPEDFT